MRRAEPFLRFELSGLVREATVVVAGSPLSSLDAWRDIGAAYPRARKMPVALDFLEDLARASDDPAIDPAADFIRCCLQHGVAKARKQRALYRYEMAGTVLIAQRTAAIAWIKGEGKSARAP